MLVRTWNKVIKTCMVGINKVVYQKIGNQSTTRLSYTTSGYIPKEHPILPQGHLLAVLFIGQKQETTWMSLNQ